MNKRQKKKLAKRQGARHYDKRSAFKNEIVSGFLTLLKVLKETGVINMLTQKEYYDIIIKDNNLAEVDKIDVEKYNYFKNTFNYVYHTENSNTYPLHKNLDAGIDMLIVDDEHLHELLDDLIEQGFCDTIEFNFIEDYFNGNYNQYRKAF